MNIYINSTLMSIPFITPFFLDSQYICQKLFKKLAFRQHIWEKEKPAASNATNLVYHQKSPIYQGFSGIVISNIRETKNFPYTISHIRGNSLRLFSLHFIDDNCIISKLNINLIAHMISKCSEPLTLKLNSWNLLFTI